MRAAAICLAFAALLSCDSGDGVSEIRLIDGRTIGDAVSAEGMSVVLVYSPDRCFSCAGILGRWVQLDREAASLQVALILRSEPDEREKPIGNDRGFLWRLNSYWRYQQVDEGVIVECESVSLSRSVPAMLRWMIGPIINRTARETLTATLTSMSEVLRERAPQELPAAE